MKNKPLPITQHIRYGLTPLPFGTLPSATSYMLGTLGDISSVDYIRSEKIGDKLWKSQIGS